LRGRAATRSRAGWLAAVHVLWPNLATKAQTSSQGGPEGRGPLEIVFRQVDCESYRASDAHVGRKSELMLELRSLLEEFQAQASRLASTT